MLQSILQAFAAATQNAHLLLAALLLLRRPPWRLVLVPSAW